MPYSDGTYTSPVQDGPKRTFYPFVNNPTKDTTTKGTVRNYVVLPGSFTPAAALSTDPDDATQYLIEETEPQIDGGIARFTRTYCKVPSDQIVYRSRAISAPDVSQYGVSNSRNYYGTGTAYPLYSYGSKLWHGPTIYGPSTAATSVDNGANTDITCTAHGITAADGIIVSWSVTSVVFGDAITIVDANTIRVLGVNMGTAVTAIWRKFRTYTPGTYQIRTKETQRFYLPTVTSGITTPADIPIPVGSVNDTVILSAVAAATSGLITYDSSDLEPWLNSPIYSVTEIEIDIGDL